MAKMSTPQRGSARIVKLLHPWSNLISSRFQSRDAVHATDSDEEDVHNGYQTHNNSRGIAGSAEHRMGEFRGRNSEYSNRGSEPLRCTVEKAHDWGHQITWRRIKSWLRTRSEAGRGSRHDDDQLLSHVEHARLLACTNRYEARRGMNSTISVIMHDSIW